MTTFPGARGGSEWSWMRRPLVAFCATRSGLLEGEAAAAGFDAVVELARISAADQGRTDRAIRVFRLSAAE